MHVQVYVPFPLSSHTSAHFLLTTSCRGELKKEIIVSAKCSYEMYNSTLTHKAFLLTYLTKICIYICMYKRILNANKLKNEYIATAIFCCQHAMLKNSIALIYIFFLLSFAIFYW